MTDFANHLDTYVPDRLRELNLPGASIALIENGEAVEYFDFQEGRTSVVARASPLVSMTSSSPNAIPSQLHRCLPAPRLLTIFHSPQVGCVTKEGKAVGQASIDQR